MFEKLKFWKRKRVNKIIPKIFNKKVKFPCENCLILPLGCYQLCDKVEMDNDKLKQTIFKAAEKDGGLHCPDCGHTEWYDGPSGGLCTNCKCCKCNHWFNFAPGLMCFERIHIDPKTKRIYD